MGNECHEGAIAVLCGWEGNHWSDVTTKMDHMLHGISTFRLSNVNKEDEHPTYIVGIWYPSSFQICLLVVCGSWSASV